MNNTANIQVMAIVAEMQGCLARLTAVVSADASVDAAPAADTMTLVPDEGTQTERILAFLRQRPGAAVSRRELRDAFPMIKDNSLSGAVTRLKDRGQIEVVGRGRYRVRPSTST